MPPSPEDEFIPFASPAPRVARRFCTRCGSLLNDADPCGPCFARQSQASLLPSADDGGQRSTKGALTLYFSLLGVCVIGMFAGIAQASEINIDIGVSVGITTVVLIGVGMSWRNVLPLLKQFPRAYWFGIAVGMSFLTIAIAVGVIRAFQHFAHVPEQRMSTPFLNAGYGWGWIVLFWCVQPAIFEELAFRGTIMSALSRALSPFETVLVSAMMFMILHLSPARFPHTFALGLAAGYLRLRTRSLYPCILLHFCHNFACVGAEWANL